MYVSHKVNVFVTDIILNITSQEHLIFTSLHIGSRLFELFSKEVRVKKQPGMSLNDSGYSNILEALTIGSIEATQVVMPVVVALLILPYITVVTVTFLKPLQWDQGTPL